MSFMTAFDPEHIASLLTLVFLEIVLAADNLLLIAILSSRLPEHQRNLARQVGLIGAVGTRLLLLLSLFWLSHLETPIPLDAYGLAGQVITPRQIVLGLGGLFLVWKSFAELISFFRENGAARTRNIKPATGVFLVTIVQIALFDVIFSLDSVIAAIAIARHIEIMIAAVIIAAMGMLFLVNPISHFIEAHPTVKMIALNFLTLIGVLLIAEATHLPVERTYFYVALIVAILVQLALFWLLSMPRIVRAGAAVAATAAAAFLALGFWHSQTGQGGIFRDGFLAASGAWSEAIGAISTAANWIRPFFDVG